ncbi:deoxyribonuclease-1-like [Macrobrachium rosenbergii]|uniref:deoxyribonuclease-1-like n=1 Tax=Macrobrachium rosenbergii TaxID=79674 RepID=UPI0034D60DF8
MGWSPFALVVILAAFGTAQGTGTVQNPVRVGTWNLQRFGPTKMGKPEVVAKIVQVMRRYDIIVILEVVDADEVVPGLLLNALNSGLTNTYNLTISKRLGRTSYQEQYAFYWKPSVVRVNFTFQYNDTVLDKFQFEPFIVVFEGKFDSNLPRFGFIPLHAKPSDAVPEIDALVDVYDTFKQRTGIEDVIIAGDFNAGCTYVGGNDYPKIRLFTDSRFTWLISDHADTTTEATTCPYDRIVTAGNKMLGATYENTAQAYYFDEELGITNASLVDDISDHYPVEVLIKGSNTIDSSKVHPGTSISVAISVTPADLSNFSFSSMTNFMVMAWVSPNATAAVSSIVTFSQNNPNILSAEGLAVLLYKYNNGGLTDSTLHGEYYQPGNHTVTVYCNSDQNLCTTTWTVFTPIN